MPRLFCIEIRPDPRKRRGKQDADDPGYMCLVARTHRAQDRPDGCFRSPRLDTLSHCRERVKVAARAADATSRHSYIEVLQAGAYALGDPGLIRELLALSLDVV